MNPWLDSLVFSWWSFMAPLAVQAAVLVPLVALIDRLLPRQTWPQLRATMWLFVMARLLLSPNWLTTLELTAWLPAAIPSGTAWSRTLVLKRLAEEQAAASAAASDPND